MVRPAPEKTSSPKERSQSSGLGARMVPANAGHAPSPTMAGASRSTSEAECRLFSVERPAPWTLKDPGGRLPKRARDCSFSERDFSSHQGYPGGSSSSSIRIVKERATSLVRDLATQVRRHNEPESCKPGQVRENNLHSHGSTPDSACASLDEGVPSVAMVSGSCVLEGGRACTPGGLGRNCREGGRVGEYTRG